MIKASKNNKSGQSAFEFVMLLGFALLFVLIMMYFLQNSLLDIQKTRNEQETQQIANILLTEMTLAESAPTQYSRTFSLPNSIRGTTYNIYSPDGREIVIDYNGRQYVYFLSGQALRNYSLLQPGDISIKKTCISQTECLLELYTPPTIHPTWWNQQFKTRKQITIYNVGTTTLSDYPAYIKINKTENMKNDLSDIRFIQGTCNLGATGTQLSFELESTESETYWWNSNFTKRKQITITNTGSTELSNYTAYLKIKKEDAMKSDYSDIRFIDGSCDTSATQLNYELENYDSENAHFWIKIPSLKTGTKQICLYYGNSLAETQSAPQTVWNMDQVLVQHFKDGEGLSTTDSSGNGITGTLSGATEWLLPVNCVVGNCLFFNESIVNLGSLKTYNTYRNYTVSFWMNIQELKRNGVPTSSAGIIEGITGTSTQLYHNAIRVRSLNQIRSDYSIEYGLYNSTDISVLNYQNMWTHIAVTYDGNIIKIYRDGTYVNQAIIGAITDNGTVSLRLGNWGGSYRIIGSLDELKVSNISKSADWIKQDYQMIKNQSSVVSAGSEQNYSVAYGNFWVKIPALVPGENAICLYYDNSLATSQSNPAQVWSSDHVFVHHLNELTGTFFDSTSNSKDGTAYGGVTRGVPGKVGAGVAFDGSSGRVSVSPTALTNAFTFSTWAYYITHEGNYAGLINSLNGYGGRNRILLNNNNAIYFQPINSTGSYDLFFAIPSTYKNSWRHYTLTYDGQSLKAYYDGQPTGVVHNLTGNLLTGTSNSTLGWGSSSIYHLNGYMDETKIYNVAKSADWIKQDYDMVQNQATRVIQGEEETK